MKHILIATDFSPASEQAVDYGIHMAAALGAAVTIFSAYQEIPVPVADTMSMTFIDTAAARDSVEQGLRRLHRQFRTSDVAIGTLAVKGAIVPSILHAADRLKADLIVTGMKGKGRPIRRLLGSTATTLARKTPVTSSGGARIGRFSAAGKHPLCQRYQRGYGYPHP
ncbi:universal stress protein [Puia sp. P3]|uniref:universal stress protein n=1 Tax=Puia sp. P3 TaxID=3423952 RepID=UPI003D66CD7B